MKPLLSFLLLAISFSGYSQSLSEVDLVMDTVTYSKLTQVNLQYSSIVNNCCVPFLIGTSEKKIFIQDSCIDDTLKIWCRTEIIFKENISDSTLIEVKLIDINIYFSDNEKVHLSHITPISSFYYKYIWDLCYAKLSFWYSCQPYEQLQRGEVIQDGLNRKLYMGATLFIVPILNN
jgi:hypothetical protein